MYHTINKAFMKLILLLFLLIISHTFASTTLQSNYFISHNYVTLADIVINPKENIELFKIDPLRHTKRVKSKKLLEILRAYGYNEYSSKHSYIQFTQKSPIDTAKIAFEVKKFFINHYKNIKFTAVDIHPRTYLLELPKHYEVQIQKRAYLKSKGTLSIKTEDNKKIFFNFRIKATLPVVIAKERLNCGDELSRLNCKKKSIILDKFRAIPLQVVPYKTYEAKRRIKKDAVVTAYDILGLQLVKRGENIDVSTEDGTISISFTAKADQSGRLGDTIRVINMHGKRIKAVVIGKNRAEIR